MDEFLRAAGSGDQVEPATRDVHGGVKSQDAIGERIAMVMIVKEPSVKVGVAKGSLNSGDAHAADSTAIDASALSEHY
jgi:hypothetical protein